MSICDEKGVGTTVVLDMESFRVVGGLVRNVMIVVYERDRVAEGCEYSVSQLDVGRLDFCIIGFF